MTTPNPPASDAYGHRYSSLVDLPTIQEATFAVIGCGAIGHAICRLLRQAAVSQIVVFDPDDIEDVNVGPQGFPPTSIGQPKALFFTDETDESFPQTQVFPVLELYPSEIAEDILINHPPAVIFTPVDSMTSRAAIFNSICQLPRPFLLVDTRMSAEVARIISVRSDQRDSLSHYKTTLYSDDDAIQEDCTSRSTPWCPPIAASFAVRNAFQFLSNRPIPRDLLISIPQCQAELLNETPLEPHNIRSLSQ